MMYILKKLSFLFFLNPGINVEIGTKLQEDGYILNGSFELSRFVWLRLAEMNVGADINGMYNKPIWV